MTQVPLWPPFEALQDQLAQWQRAHSPRMSLEVLGDSAQGRPLYAACFTDPEADEEHKEHALITCLHSGIERSATTSAFALMEWLLSGEPQAQETLGRQVVCVMPLCNPDGYALGSHATTTGGNPYGGWTPDGPLNPETTPESVAVQQVMDRLQPDVHADIHGLDLSFPGYMSLENSGASYSNFALRPYHQDVARLMDEAALAEGFPSDLVEQDAERLLWGPELDAISPRLWTGRPRFYAALYCYGRYHSLVLASEAMWTRSGFVRHRRLLQVGNETWPGEQYPGYPVRIVSWNILGQVAAWGDTAGRRRRSRVELWSKLGQITHGLVNPQREGVAVHVCATSRAAAEQWLGDGKLSSFLERLERHPTIEAEPLRRLLAEHPTGAGQWGPSPHLHLVGGEGDGPEAPIEHGIAVRLRIPHRAARILDLRLNGTPLAPSATDGFDTWSARGYRFVQVNVPPARSRREDLLVITCRHDPGERRLEGWTPGR